MTGSKDSCIVLPIFRADCSNYTLKYPTQGNAAAREAAGADGTLAELASQPGCPHDLPPRHTAITCAVVRTPAGGVYLKYAIPCLGA